MKDLFAMLCIRYAKRNTPKRKRFFLKWMVDNCAQMKIKHRLDETQNKRMRSINLICGDLKRADVVFVAGYDTPNKIYIPGYKYYPFDEKKNQKAELISLILQLVMSFITLMALFFLIRGWYGYNIWMKVACVLGSIVLVIATFLFGKGAANKYNFNKNNSGLCAVMTLLTKSVEKKYQNIAFVFTDYSTGSFAGFQQLSEMREVANKNVVILDCIASDGDLFASYNTGGKAIATALNEIEPNCQLIDHTDAVGVFSLFRKLTYITSGNRVGENQVAVTRTRTRKDANVNFEKIERVYNMVETYMNQIGETKD